MIFDWYPEGLFRYAKQGTKTLPEIADIIANDLEIKQLSSDIALTKPSNRVQAMMLKHRLPGFHPAKLATGGGSGLVYLDFDDVANIDTAKQKLMGIGGLVLLALSGSGAGLHAIYRAQAGEAYYDSWQKVASQAIGLGVVPDLLQNRAINFFSCSHDSNVYLNL